jgi:hypothetical protein
MVFVIKSTTQKRIAQDLRKEICDKPHTERMRILPSKCPSPGNVGLHLLLRKIIFLNAE